MALLCSALWLGQERRAAGGVGSCAPGQEPVRARASPLALGALDLLGVVAHTSKEGALTRADVERFFQVDLLPRLLPQRLPGHARVPGSVRVRVQARLRWTTPAFTRAAI